MPRTLSSVTDATDAVRVDRVGWVERSETHQCRFSLREGSLTRRRPFTAQPIVPLGHALAGTGRESEDRYSGIDLARARRHPRNVEVYIRQQIDLADQHQRGGA